MPDDTITEDETPVNFNQNAALAMARRRNPVTFAARHDPYLPPWAVKYALWLVDSVPQPGTFRKRPRDGFGASDTERRMKLQSLTRAEWNGSAIKALHRRADFHELLGKLTGARQAAVRAALEANGFRYVEILEKSADALLEGGDYKNAGELAMKAINQILPKGPDVAAATAITVNISAKQLAGIDADAITVEATPLE